MRDLGVLGELGEEARERVRARRQQVPWSQLEERARQRGPARDLASALRRPGEVAVIAEFKRRSPSRGAIREDAQPQEVALRYARAGAAALSVLTEPTRFGGSLEDLEAVSRVVSLPVLEKDFVVDPYQIVEARAYGADAVLLIVALVGEALAELLACAREVGVGALVEVHREEELQAALRAGATVVGVNHRDLVTLRVDRGVGRRLLPRIPLGVTAVAESGLQEPTHVAEAAWWGADAVLVGESLMASADPEATLVRLREGGRPFVKVCGVMHPEDAQMVSEAGADAVGVVLAPSPRQLTPDKAREVCQAAGDLWRVGVVSPPREKGPQAAVDLAWEMAHAVGLTAVQLHGGWEPPEVVAQLGQAGLAVLAAVAAGDPQAPQRARELSQAGAWVLVDARVGNRTDAPSPALDPGAAGGVVRAVRRAVVAGGLTPETVGEVVRATGAFGADVSSGVEVVDARGIRRKDREQVARFVRAVREAARMGAG
jgi:indole-3-glycerol phosphate synthase/phosphoribosylanthranilate isomerase